MVVSKKLKKITQKVLTSICVASLLITPTLITGMSSSTSVFAASTTTISLTKSGGWLESAYVEWIPVTGASGYNVYYKSANALDSQYIKIDDPLIRKYSSHYRADVLGLKAGNYVIKVVPVVSGSENTSLATTTEALTVKAHTREGFAFSSQSPMGTGSGGYNNDGTVPDNAAILYITPATANTVTASVITSSSGTKTTCTGLTDILSARQKGYDKTPLIIRLIGQIKGSDITGLNSSGYVQVKGCYNITFEGIGDDATVNQWGFLVRSAHNIEIRNLGIMLFPDDAISLDTENQNIWVHNNDIFYGSPGSDADQVKGDGSTDVKGFSDYITVSYNHYWDSGKVSLCGMSESKEFHVTYHHNWFDHSDSRHPRIRVGTVHIYNNFFDGNAKYGVGNTSGGSAFVEANYFKNCKYPMLISMQGTDIYNNSEGTFSGEPGGMTKAYNNTVTGAARLIYTNQDAVQFDAYLATSRTETVPATYKTVNGSNTYNNFDTSSTMYKYTPDDPSAVQSKVTTYAGRVNGGDFKWTFTDSDDADSSVNAALKQAILDYKPDQAATASPLPTSSSTPAPTPTSTQVPTPGNITPGDLDGNGKINSTDYSMLKKALLGLMTLSSSAQKAGDVNGDGKINSADIAKLKRIILGLDTPSTPVPPTPTPIPATATPTSVPATPTPAPGNTVTVKDFDSLKNAAVNAANGQIIEIASNLLDCTSQLLLDKPDSNITIKAASGYTPVLDFKSFREAAKKTSPSQTGDSYVGIRISGSKYILKGLIIQKAYDNGILIKPASSTVSPDGNTVDSCVLRYNGDAGLQISGSQTYEDQGFKVRPNNTTVINCVAYRNFDILTEGGNADGFAAKLYLGKGTKFINCASIENSDDAWDSFGINDSDVTYTNCIAYHCGDSAIFDGTYDKAKGLPEDTDMTVGTCSGNGNGFKMGSGDSKYGPQTNGIKTLTNCVAVDNISKGVDENNGTGTINCTNTWSFGNLKGDFVIDLMKAGTFTSNQAGTSKNLKNPSGGTVTVNANVPRAEFDASIAKIRQQIKANQIPAPVTFSWWK
ncbi:MAG TPA: dockerin type I domain-containing protein [Clostridia bacterium]